MGYAAITLGLLGFALGTMFRLRVLLPSLGLLLLVSIVFSLSRGLGFRDTALTIMAAQTIAQGSYFLGLVARAVFTTHGARHLL
jgi:hypothetical protein